MGSTDKYVERRIAVLKAALEKETDVARVQRLRRELVLAKTQARLVSRVLDRPDR